MLGLLARRGGTLRPLIRGPAQVAASVLVPLDSVSYHVPTAFCFWCFGECPEGRRLVLNVDADKCAGCFGPLELSKTVFEHAHALASHASGPLTC